MALRGTHEIPVLVIPNRAFPKLSMSGICRGSASLKGVHPVPIVSGKPSPARQVRANLPVVLVTKRDSETQDPGNQVLGQGKRCLSLSGVAFRFEGFGRFHGLGGSGEHVALLQLSYKKYSTKRQP